MFISKRKFRYVLFLVFGVVIVSCFVRAVVQSQYNKEIKYFKTYFEQRKDGLESVYNPLAIKQIPEEAIDLMYNVKLAKLQGPKESIDWSKYAYVNYATDANYLCNTLVMFDELRRFGTKAKLLLLMSRDIAGSETSQDSQQVTRMLNQLKSEGGDQVVIKYVDTIFKRTDTTQWSQSMTKLLVFNQTEYDRVIFLDNDAMLQDKLDELFFLPDYVEFAAPLSYWLLSEGDMNEAYREVKEFEKNPVNLARYTDKLRDRIKKNKMIYNHLPSLPPNLFLNSRNVAQDLIRSKFSLASLFDHHLSDKSSKVKFASNVMVIKPSAQTFSSIMKSSVPTYLKKEGKYDGDVINDDLFNLRKVLHTQFKLFRRLRTHFVPSVLVLPYARYGFLTGSIKNESQHVLLRNDILGCQRRDTSGKEIAVDIAALKSNAKYIHFSDYQLGKPWEYRSIDEIKCSVDEKKSKDIEASKKICHLWNDLYSSYLNSRGICTA